MENFKKFRSNKIDEEFNSIALSIGIPFAIILVALFQGDLGYWIIYLFIPFAIIMLSLIKYYLPSYRNDVENTYSKLNYHFKHSIFYIDVDRSKNNQVFDYSKTISVLDSLPLMGVKYNHIKLGKVMDSFYWFVLEKEGNCFELKEVTLFFFKEKIISNEFKSAL